MRQTNYLVIGSGIAGLSFSVKMAEKFPNRSIIIVTKNAPEESNTRYAQGGMAVVQNVQSDSFQKHITDTLIAGDGLCQESIVKMVVKEGPERLKELIEWGANFDNNAEGILDLGREGGHSEDRVVHHKDLTGFEIARALLQYAKQLKNITILSFHFAIDLITEHHIGEKKNQKTSCYGAYVLNQQTKKIDTIVANATVLASGGIGNVYGHTTNPIIATGDGIAMAYRATAKISNMEFVQFHPTALYSATQEAAFLISEAVRGFGAHLRTKKGERFMLKYDTRAELASRDIVSQSIDKELKKSGDTNVYLDCTHLNIEAFKTHFPTIYKKCISLNIDLKTTWIPVVPAAHYLCGGIDVNENGKTTVKNLFACGECSNTGLHGANRLASNSLLEALVYAHRIAKYLSDKPINFPKQHIPKWNDFDISSFQNKQFINASREQLQSIMQKNVGIVRSTSELKQAIQSLEVLYNEVSIKYATSKINTALCELRNMSNIAHLIMGQSLARKTNKGGYFNKDYT